MSMHLSTVLKYYKRPEIQAELVAAALDKEVAISYQGKGYGKRPDTLNFPSEVIQLVQKGATSFHCSEELWIDPLRIKTGAPKKEMDVLRKGWDLILDIDCPKLQYSMFAADLLIKALQYHDISSVSVKFSGNHGFHIAVPFKSFPKIIEGKKTSTMFPKGPRAIAGYLKEFIREFLKKTLLEFEKLDEIALNVGKDKDELLKNGVFDPFEVLEIDTILISSRHLYRMPYSLNEKSGLVSIPILPEEVINFDKNTAIPKNVVPRDFRFLDDSNTSEGEAKELLVNAMDAKALEDVRKEEAFSKEVKGYSKNKEFRKVENPIEEDAFPPCIRQVLQGLEDGKKRALFILVNFFRNVGWSDEDIRKRIKEWNELHPNEQLSETIIQGHLRHHLSKKEGVMPPNCDNKQYYQDLRICNPDSLCRKVKNPVNYTIIRSKLLKESQEQKEKDDEKLKKQKERYEKEKKKGEEIRKKRKEEQETQNQKNNEKQSIEIEPNQVQGKKLIKDQNQEQKEEQNTKDTQ